MKIIQQVKRWLNLILMIYPRWVCKREYNHQKFTSLNERPVEFSFLFKKVTEIWPKTILDVGTGTTALPHMLRNTGLLVTAIDNIKDYWIEGMVNRHFHVVNDDIQKTKLDNNFDVITCISVLEHIEDHRAAMKSMYSLLNPGGTLILTCPYSNQQYVPNVYKLPESLVTENFSFVTQSFSENEREVWMEDSSFTLVDEEYWQFFEGKFWTCGKMLSKPVKVHKNETHQICCMAFKKTE
jgi:trans-aconitate methyltransferase